MKCPKCKSEIPNDSLFCEQCGAKVVDEIPDDNRGISNSNKKKYLWYIVYAFWFVIVGIIVFVVSFNEGLRMIDIVGIIALVSIGVLLFHAAKSTNK